VKPTPRVALRARCRWAAMAARTYWPRARWLSRGFIPASTRETLPREKVVHGLSPPEYLRLRTIGQVHTRCRSCPSQQKLRAFASIQSRAEETTGLRSSRFVRPGPKLISFRSHRRRFQRDDYLLCFHTSRPLHFTPRHGQRPRATGPATRRHGGGGGRLE
jgi:hypothetical protein